METKMFLKLIKKHKSTISNVWIGFSWLKNNITISIPSQLKRKKHIPVFINAFTGEVKFELPENNYLMEQNKSKNFTYMQYIKTEDVIACYTYQNDNYNKIDNNYWIMMYLK